MFLLLHCLAVSAQVAQARNMSIREHRHCCITFDIWRILHRGAKIRILFSSGETIFYERAQQVSEMLFLPRENKIHIFAPRCNVLFII